MDRRSRARAMLERTAAGGDATLGRRLERAIYNYCIETSRRDKIPQTWRHPQFRDRYCQKVMSIKFNATHPKNPALGDKLRRGDVTVDWIVRASPQDLFPELWEPVYEKVAYKALRKQLTVDLDKAPDGQFTCGKCKSRKTTFYEMQTRSADEPMTVFVQCLNCGKRWKG